VAQEVQVRLVQVQVLAPLVLVQQEGVLMEVQEQVLPLLEQEVPPQEVHQSNLQGQELPQEVLPQGQEVLQVLAQVRQQVQLLEALLRAQAGVLLQVQEQVLELALGVGLQQVVLERGQVLLAQRQAKEQVLK
jgi:hypothetical protein